jgi:hypothetical protein
MWKYEQRTGVLYDPSGKAIEKGYSGKVPEGVNRPEKQGVSGIGPIPRGWYRIGAPIEFHGMPTCMPLAPFESTETFGRTGFLIHGDNTTHTASTGCIVVGPDTRTLIVASSDKRLQVVGDSTLFDAVGIEALRSTEFLKTWD